MLTYADVCRCGVYHGLWLWGMPLSASTCLERVYMPCICTAISYTCTVSRRWQCRHCLWEVQCMHCLWEVPLRAGCFLALALHAVY
jgi:hypothetical protein